MIKLFLLRHAKSDWQSFDTDDFNRDIIERGIKKTIKIGKLLNKNNTDIFKILCSPALRTKKTKDIIIDFLVHKPIVEYNSELYHESGANLLDILKAQKEEKSILIIGHEPMLSNLVISISEDYENKHFQNASRNYVTSALFCVDFYTKSWSKISKKNSRINYFIRPNDL